MSGTLKGIAAMAQEQSDNAWIYRTLKSIFIIMAIAIILAIAGVTLGAANFMGGPIHYAIWLLAVWFVVDILLLVFLLLHLTLYGILISDSSGQGSEVLCVIFGIIFLIGEGVALSGKHLAYVSASELLLLVAATVIDVIIVIHHA